MANEQPKNNSSVQISSPQTSSVGASTPKLIGTFVAGIILGALIIWGIVALRVTQGTSTPTQTTTTALATTTTTATTEQSGSSLGGSITLPTTPVSPQGSLTISSQLAGTNVEVTGIMVTTPTWIVVYDDNAGVPGNVLGAALVYPHESAITVGLLRPTVSGKTYLVGESTSLAGSHGYARQTTTPLNVWSTFTAQ